MAFVPFDNVCQVEIRYRYLGEKAENTLYFHRPEGMGETHVRTMVDAIADWWAISLRPLQHHWLTHHEVFGRRLEYEGDYTYTNTFYQGEEGTRVLGEGHPGNVSLSVAFKSAYAGRCNRGRNYAIAISTEDTDGNQVSIGYAASLLLAYSELVNPSLLYPTSIFWCVASRWYNHQQRVEGVPVHITHVTITSRNIDSMRRRLAGRGE